MLIIRVPMPLTLHVLDIGSVGSTWFEVALVFRVLVVGPKELSAFELCFFISEFGLLCIVFLIDLSNVLDGVFLGTW